MLTEMIVQQHTQEVSRLREVWVGALADMADAGVVLPGVVLAEVEFRLDELESTNLELSGRRKR